MSFFRSTLGSANHEELTQNIKLITQIMGYMIYPDNEISVKNLYYLYGNTGTGKSSYAKLLELIIGKDKVSNINLDALSSQDNKFLTSCLVNKNLNISSEEEGIQLKRTQSFIKSVSSNTITTERKNQDPVSSKLHCKFLVTSNNYPFLNNNDMAFKDRLTILPINNPNRVGFRNIAKGKEVSKILFEKENCRNFIMSIILQGLSDLVKNGAFYGMSITWQNINDKFTGDTIMKDYLRYLYKDYQEQLGTDPNTMLGFNKEYITSSKTWRFHYNKFIKEYSMNDSSKLQSKHYKHTLENVYELLHEAYGDNWAKTGLKEYNPHHLKKLEKSLYSRNDINIAKGTAMLTQKEILKENLTEYEKNVIELNLKTYTEEEDEDTRIWNSLTYEQQQNYHKPDFIYPPPKPPFELAK